MWISVWITFNKNSNDYYYCFSNLPRIMPCVYLHTPCAPYLCIVTAHYPACYPTCKNVQYPSYTKKHTIILYNYGMFTIRVYLHFQKRQSLPQGGDVFNSHANFKIVSNFHTIHQITPNSLR